MMLLVICFLSTRLWSIQIQGNIMNPTSQLLEFLDQQGIIHAHCRDLPYAQPEEQNDKFFDVFFILILHHNRNQIPGVRRL